jgi:hypothetical protein
MVKDKTAQITMPSGDRSQEVFQDRFKHHIIQRFDCMLITQHNRIMLLMNGKRCAVGVVAQQIPFQQPGIQHLPVAFRNGQQRRIQINIGAAVRQLDDDAHLIFELEAADTLIGEMHVIRTYPGAQLLEQMIDGRSVIHNISPG